MCKKNATLTTKSVVEMFLVMTSVNQHKGEFNISGLKSSWTDPVQKQVEFLVAANNHKDVKG